MNFEERMEGEVLIARLSDSRLDAQCAEAFKTTLIKHVDEGRTQIVLNMAAVEFVDSSGLGAMVAVLRKVSGSGKLALCELTEQVGRMFELTRMNKVFKILGDEGAAVKLVS